jgi:hypothetical protein
MLASRACSPKATASQSNLHAHVRAGLKAQPSGRRLAPHTVKSTISSNCSCDCPAEMAPLAGSSSPPHLAPTLRPTTSRILFEPLLLGQSTNPLVIREPMRGCSPGGNGKLLFFGVGSAVTHAAVHCRCVSACVTPTSAACTLHGRIRPVLHPASPSSAATYASNLAPI